MKKFIIVNKESLQIMGSYEAPAKDDTSANRSWLLAEPVCMHLEMPEGLDADCLKCEDGAIVLDEAKAAAKLQAKRDAKLEEIRKLREPKLVRVDQLVNIAVLNSWTAAEKTELKNYRKALLDLTNDYKEDPSLLDDLDVSSIEFPEEPSEA